MNSQISANATAITNLANGAVKNNTDAIAAINNETTGILAQAKGYTDGLNTTTNNRIAAVEESLAQGGGSASIAQIIAKINELDADISSAEVEAGKGVKVQVVETDGKITAVNVTGDYSNAYDSKGSAEAVNTTLTSYKTSNDTAVKKISDDLAAEVTRSTNADTNQSNRIATIENDYLKTADKTALANSIKANTDALITLNGSGDGSVSKQVSDAIAAVVASAPDSYNTLKKIADWITTHTTEASNMNTQINTNKSDISNLKSLVGTLPAGTAATTIVGYVDSVVAALKIGDYAKAADLAQAVTRISSLESASHTHSNKGVIDQITQDNLSSWNAAASNSHTHSNKAELDKIATGDVSKWNSKSRVIFSTTQPSDLTINDLWVALD